MGGLVGAALVYANYFHAIDIFEGGKGVRTLRTAGLFSTFAVSKFNSEKLIVALTDDVAAGLHDECIVFLLGVPRNCSSGHPSSCHNRRRKCSTTKRLISYHLVPSDSRRRFSVGDGDRYARPCLLPLRAKLAQAYAINPARDLGPRLLTSMVGYGKAVYTFRK